MRRLVALGLFAFAVLGLPAIAALRGHGGPVRAVAISADGRLAITGSFDTSAIIWTLDGDRALTVLRFHDKAVNAVAVLAPGRFATAGEDGRIALWTAGATTPERFLDGHTAPVSGLAVSPDGRWLASSSWDRSLRLWPLDGGAPRVLEGHRDNVNGVAFSADGSTLVSAGYDATVRIWPVAGGPERILTFPAAHNAVVTTPDGSIIIGSADGMLRLLDGSGALRLVVPVSEAPIVALAVSRDGQTIAASGLRGAVVLVDAASGSIRATLVGPALPVWSLAFSPDGRTVFAAGSDRIVRRWDARSGAALDGTLASATDTLLKTHAGDPGAEVFRACIACHTLAPDDESRAGPSLHGLFGRKIATAPGYRYFPALGKLDIVWTPETVARLFELGPATFTPGTKMPEQTLSSADRAALIAFLAKVTR